MDFNWGQHLKEKANMSGIVQIPKPCHESWQAMHPQANGRFCDSCCKVVVDFTNFSNQEIVDYLQSKNNERVCGRFKKEQVKQPASTQIIQLKDRNKIWKLQQFAAALLLAFGSILFTSCNTSVSKTKTTTTKERITGVVIIPTEMQYHEEKELRNDTIKKTTKKNTTCEQAETELMGDTILPEVLIGKIAYPEPVIDTANQHEEIIKGEVQDTHPK